MPLRRAIYPGSFDPVTVGHLDIIRRAARLFDSLIVAVAHNDAKNPLFDVKTRLAMLHSATGDVPGVVIRDLDGLLVDFARKEEAFVVIRGLRAVSDFEFEFQMALMNRRLEGRMETVFLAPREDCTFLSSRIVKEIAHFGGDVSSFVTEDVARHLKEKFSSA